MENIFNYFTRVKFREEDLVKILNQIIEMYHFSSLKKYHIIETGYEDFNVYLETSHKKYVIKFFSNDRSLDNINHYIKIIEIISKQKYIHIPKVYYHNDRLLGEIDYDGKSIYFYVMEYISGKTIYDLDKNVSLKTMIQIVFDILKYNCINTSLKKYLSLDSAKKNKQYDMWSYENFLQEYQDKKKYLSEDDQNLIKPVVLYYQDMIKRYESYNKKFHSLSVMPPFVSLHNDFISTNIILKEDVPYYIDFSVSSIALNFIDIAIFGCDTVLKKDISSSEYVRYLKIISYILYRVHIMEYNLYPSFVAVQHAIHLLIANYYKVCEGVDAEENEYFLNLGRMGLQYIEKENLLNKPVFNWIKEDNWYLRSELGEESEYSKVREDIIHLGLFDFIEEQIKEYYRLYNRNRDNQNYDKLYSDDLYHKGYDWLYSSIENVSKDGVVMAISFCNDNEWNGTHEENIWTKLNMEALNRGVLMKRVFVYPDNRKSLVLNNKDISRFVHYKGNNLELGFISDKKIKEVLGDNYSKIYPGVLVFNQDIAFIDNNTDPENRGYSVFDKDKITNYYELYDIVKSNCD